MQWFGGDLVVTDIHGTVRRYSSLSFSQAIAKLKEVCDDPSRIREAMYYPYPTDIKDMLL